MPIRPFCYKHGKYYLNQCPECARELDTFDIDRLAEKRVKGKEQVKKDNAATQNIIEGALNIKYEGKFKICPDCGHRSLLYDEVKEKDICWNPNCQTNLKSFNEMFKNETF